MGVIEDLEYLAKEYESGDYVDISAQNYFQDALDEIRRLRDLVRAAYVEGFKKHAIDGGYLDLAAFHDSMAKKILGEDKG